MNPPGADVTVYEITEDPPSLAGALKLTFALRFPVAVATIEFGALGGPTVKAKFDGLDALESPDAFLALTVNV